MSECPFGLIKDGLTRQTSQIRLIVDVPLKTIWQLQTTKAKFSEVVELCAEEGPQTITKHGRPVAHLVSHQDYELLQRPAHKVDIAAKARRLRKMFGGRKLRGNPVLDSRE